MSKLIFKNYGGSYQLRVQNAQDLEKIQVLDDAYWENQEDISRGKY